MIGWLKRHPRMVFAVSLTLLVLGLLGLTGWYLFLRPLVIRVPGELPPGFPAKSFSHASFESLLETYVTPDGKVRYDAWSKDPGGLRVFDRYLAALAKFSPKNAPERFPDEAARLVYWLNAYNACVIKGVLVHWPIRSVHDVKAPLELKAGQGFFWRLHFVIGGRAINLYRLENEIIRGGFKDPRIHFVLNCASGGCPALRADIPEGADLDAYLDRATRDFLDARVAVDHGAKTVTISPIFAWYEEDFLGDLARRGVPQSKRSLLRWVQLAGFDAGDDYTLGFADYDWSVNAG